MKNKINITALLGSALLFSACDPYGASENLSVYIPPLDFEFQIRPDTAYVRLGDTIDFYAAIENPMLETEERLKDGEAVINIAGVWYEETPVTEETMGDGVRLGETFEYVMIEGNLSIFAGGMGQLFAYPQATDDSIRIHFKFIPLKTGTYGFTVQSSFFEGSQGKARTKGKFDVVDNHMYDLIDRDGALPLPGEPGYDNQYMFAVYE